MEKGEGGGISILLIYSYDGIIFFLDKRTHKNSQRNSCKFKCKLEGSKDDFNTQVIFCFYLFTSKRQQSDEANVRCPDYGVAISMRIKKQ